MLLSFSIVNLLLVACGGIQIQMPFTIGMIAEVSIHVPAIEGFKTGMTELGYVEGEDVIYLYNGVTGSDPVTIDAEIENLLVQDVDMLFTAGSLTTLRAKQAIAGTDMPVVFGAVANPVRGGFVESIAHPGGNLTGVQVGAEIPKAPEYLVRITPNSRKVYVPYNPDDWVSIAYFADLDQIASQLQIELVPGETRSVEEAVTAIENLPEDIDAIFRIPSPTLDARNEELSRAAIRRGLPMAAGHPLDEAVLLTLASDTFDVGRQAARLADQIHQGVKPGDLPIETSEFFLTINLKAAEAIGLNVPEVILLQANTVIH